MFSVYFVLIIMLNSYYFNFRGLVIWIVGELEFKVW